MNSEHQAVSASSSTGSADVDEGAVMYISMEESDSLELERLRTELDAVDAVLLDTVRARLEICSRIGELKQSEDIAVVQPARMEQVHERARDFARRHGLSPEFFDTLYDVLITETCRLEEQIIHAGTDGNSKRESE